ncbi:ABC1 kinase family protein [Pseudoalteromonas mariniglutinosa]|uniref:ABC1 kinase family protein n=1 Tax=Pseudoalteromonas mariniglutinosa TaxID=206042 RepID=UPI00384EF78C
MAKERAIPTSRFSRFATLTSMAGKVAGNMLLSGTKGALKGEGWDNKNLLLQPKNIEQLAKQLVHLRGAAMKLGQLLSMDAGDLLSPELAQLLAVLRADANPMPHKQLLGVLKSQWGNDWLDTLSHIELRPFAAASIGQVHHAVTEQGDNLAVKIQYPGIAQSVESDVDNVMTLLTMSRLLPKELDIKPLVAEAKKQLLAEADYQREAFYLQRYGELLADKPRFKVPDLYAQYSTEQILAMEYVVAKPIEHLDDLSQRQRNQLASDLIKLFFHELFDFKLIQTDPNFANFQYQISSERIVLLDFGATREVPSELSDGYRALLTAASVNDRDGVFIAATTIGYFQDTILDSYKNNVIDLFILACEPLRAEHSYHFANSDLALRMKNAGMAMSAHTQQWHTPPIDALFIHRKLAGLYLIAAKLQAQVDVKSVFALYKLAD